MEPESAGVVLGVPLDARPCRFLTGAPPAEQLRGVLPRLSTAPEGTDALRIAADVDMPSMKATFTEIAIVSPRPSCGDGEGDLWPALGFAPLNPSIRIRRNRLRHRHGMGGAGAVLLSVLWIAPFCGISCDNGRESLLHERALREAAETAKAAADAALTSAQQATAHWQIAALVACIAALLMFIIGTSLGSRARRDAHRSREEEPCDGNPKQP